jgi:hypothetical protein
MIPEIGLDADNQNCCNREDGHFPAAFASVLYCLQRGVNRGLSVLSRVHSNRYQGRKENRYESDDERDRLPFRSFFVCSCSGSMGFGG